MSSVYQLPAPEDVAGWKRLGFFYVPKSKGQGLLALAAKECLETMGCFDEVKAKLLEGRRPSQITQFIQRDRGEGLGLTTGSLNKYLRTYRLFFLSPIELLKARVGEIDPQVRNALAPRIEEAQRKYVELERLEQLSDTQWARIQKLRELEQSMNLPIPTFKSEADLMRNILNALVNLKIELGIDGYRRQPKTAVLGLVTPEDVNSLSPESRREIAMFLETFDELINMAAGR